METTAEHWTKHSPEAHTRMIPGQAQASEVRDGQLLERARQHDADAFAALVERHKDLMVNYLTRLVGCRDRAQDVAQETFVRFYQKLHSYRHQGQLKAYLLRIATNLVRSEERRRRRWRILRPLVANPTEAEPGRGPRGDLLASEEQRQVSRALADLDLNYRVPLVLREIEGRSYREIAEILGCREGTVKSRLHRGREMLKQSLTSYWESCR